MKTLKDIFIRFFPLVIVFTYSLYVPYDSDMGWHIKYGEYFFQHHAVLRENIFSTMMAGFHWINSSWATDLLTYLVFHNFSFLGISILGALVMTFTFYFFSKAAHLTFWEKTILFPILLYLESPFIEVSFRGQQLTLLAFAMLYYILSRYIAGKKKYAWCFLPLFLLWSNFHGQFILGLGILFLMLVFYILQKYYLTSIGDERKKVLGEGKYLSLIFFSSLTSTLINPFGLHIYIESLRHFGNPLQQFIIEWLPFDRFSALWWNLMFWEALVILSLGIFILRKNFFKNIHYIIPVILLLILSIQVRRYTWVLLLISIPVVRVFISSIKPKLSEISATICVLVLVFFYGYIIFAKAPTENVTAVDWNRYCDFIGCSPQAAEFLKNYKYTGKLMTFYNWGGWLIANYPEIKPSIDGRMHLWRDSSGYSAFIDYYPFEQNRKDIDQSDYNVVFMTTAKPIHRRLMELVKMGKWKIVYSDTRASIFVRIKNPPNLVTKDRQPAAKSR
ncbi:hypothetical protein HY029_03345 [Candidatus Gottesmanbacteria bacterium]|nr:hypothetical protein [Candidatus Gottesmanbacteria bacterium]